MSDYAAGALAYREGIAFEANPHVPGGPAVAQYCRLSEWPEAARQWHRGWRSEASRLAAEAEARRLAAQTQTTQAHV